MHTDILLSYEWLERFAADTNEIDNIKQVHGIRNFITEMFILTET